MNIIKSVSLALAASVMCAYSGLIVPATAQSTTTTTTTTTTSSESPPNTQFTGQVESIDGDTVTVRTTDGVVRTYDFEPGLIQTLRLTTGSDISIDTSGVRIGTIKRLSPYVANIKLADDGVDTFYIPQESRRTLFPGDTVAISPNGSITRITGNQRLTALNVRTVQAVAPSTSLQDNTQQTQIDTTQQTQQQFTQQQTQVDTTQQTQETPLVPAPQSQPVPALW